MTQCEEHVKDEISGNGQLSASEALYGFAGWITTREGAVVAGREHNAAVWADLVYKFCMKNNLVKPKDGWEKNLLHPKD